MEIGCTPFLFTDLCILFSIRVSWLAFVYLGQHLREVGDGWKIFCCGRKIFDYGWKIGWEIFRSQVYLPAFIVLKVRELRRFWKIWQIFFAYRVIMHETASLPFGVLAVFLIFQILLKKPSYSSSNIFQIPFLRPPSLTINLRSESCLRYRCTWRREMPMFSDI